MFPRIGGIPGYTSSNPLASFYRPLCLRFSLFPFFSPRLALSTVSFLPSATVIRQCVSTRPKKRHRQMDIVSRARQCPPVRWNFFFFFSPLFHAREKVTYLCLKRLEIYEKSRTKIYLDFSSNLYLFNKSCL